MKKANRTVAACIRLSRNEESQLLCIAKQLDCEGNRSEALRLLIRQAYERLSKPDNQPDKLEEVHSMVKRLVNAIIEQRAALTPAPLKPNQNTHRDPQGENEHLV